MRTCGLRVCVCVCLKKGMCIVLHRIKRFTNQCSINQNV